MTLTYRLSCARCRFERTVDGLDPTLDAVEAHEAEEPGHFVDIVQAAPDAGSDAALVGDPGTDRSPRT